MKPKTGKKGKSVEKKGKKTDSPVAKAANQKKRGVVDEVVEKVVEDGDMVAESASVELCENCGGPFDAETAEVMFCPECGATGTDQCCMSMGEEEPCQLCRDGGKGEESEESDLPDDEDDYGN